MKKNSYISLHGCYERIISTWMLWPNHSRNFCNWLLTNCNQTLDTCLHNMIYKFLKSKLCELFRSHQIQEEFLVRVTADVMSISRNVLIFDTSPYDITDNEKPPFFRRNVWDNDRKVNHVRMIYKRIKLFDNIVMRCRNYCIFISGLDSIFSAKLQKILRNKENVSIKI